LNTSRDDGKYVYQNHQCYITK